MKKSPLWSLVYKGYDPDEEGLREALCTLGNGYFATRGASPEVRADDPHYPGTYMAGLYNKLGTEMAGRTIYNEDLVNCPNWVFQTFKIGDGDWFNPAKVICRQYEQELDMLNGVLVRKVTFSDKEGRKTKVVTRRIVSMADPHRGALEYSVTPVNYSASVTFRAELDGSVTNYGVKRYRQLSSKHWTPMASGTFGSGIIFLSMRTNQSRIEVCEAARVRLFQGRREIKPKFGILQEKEKIGCEFSVQAQKGKTYTVEKNVAVYSSRDEGVDDVVGAAATLVRKPRRFESILKKHSGIWHDLWDKFDLEISGDPFSQQALRLHTFHLLQTASHHTAELDVSLPARGLHGEAYRGHIFWDTMYIMPFYNLQLPAVSRGLIKYRYRRLSEARKYAAENGYRGAMFPWQSGSTGEEETQEVHLNPVSGKWGPDLSRRQRHVSLAIAYNAWDYYKKVGDKEFLIQYGAEVLLSIAQFFASMVTYDENDGRYHTEGVMGPDEFHEKLPGSKEPGLKDNAYTNIMIVWLLLKAEECLTILPGKEILRLMRKLDLTPKDLDRMDKITRKMNVVISDDGIISQFDGYFDLEELDWDGYREKYENIHRMDRLLKAEGKSPDDYKVAKQADTLMLFYLLPMSVVHDILIRLGYEHYRTMMKDNYEYYVQRTSHGSTLSRVVHCVVAWRLHRYALAWKWCQDILKSDIYDTQGGTTPEGIHTGVMGGSIDIVMRGFGGIDFLEDRIVIKPRLPAKWTRLKMKLLYKRTWVSFTFTKEKALIEVHAPVLIPIEYKGHLHYSLPGECIEISLKKKANNRKTKK